MNEFTMEHILFSITVLGFVGSLIALFIKIGEIKTTITDRLVALEVRADKIEEHNKEQDGEISNIKQTNLQAIHRVESLLVEVSTKINMLMELSGLFKDGYKRD